MSMAAQVQVAPQYVPTTVVKAYIKSFQGNMAAAAEYGRIGYQSLDHAVKGEQRDPAFHATLWGIVRKRLTRRLLDEAMTLHEQQLFAAAEEAKEKGLEKMQKQEPLTIVALHDSLPEPAVVAKVEGRVCKGCGKLLPLTAFTQNKPGLYLPRCKPCQAALMHTSRRNAAAARRDAKAVVTPAPEVIVPEPVATTETLGLSARLLQLATEAEAMEKQVAAAGGASAAKVEELEAEVTSLRGLVKQLDETNAALRERVDAAKAYQAENAELLTRVANLTAQVASLTKENGKLWNRVDELAAECKQGKVA